MTHAGTSPLAAGGRNSPAGCEADIGAASVPVGEEVPSTDPLAGVDTVDTRESDGERRLEVLPTEESPLVVLELEELTTRGVTDGEGSELKIM